MKVGPAQEKTRYYSLIILLYLHIHAHHLRIIHCWAQPEINSLGLSYICTGRLSWENNGEANDKLVHQVVSIIIGNTIIDDLLLLFIRLSQGSYI